MIMVFFKYTDWKQVMLILNHRKYNSYDLKIREFMSTLTDTFEIDAILNECLWMISLPSERLFWI